MSYIDINNLPEDAIYALPTYGGIVEPDLLDGAIFRASSDSDIAVDRVRNQVDGLVFYFEFYNTGSSDIVVTFDNDYRATDLGYIAPRIINPGDVAYFDVICRIGLLIMQNQVGYTSDNYLRNPLDGSILINPATGQPLINPGR